MGHFLEVLHRLLLPVAILFKLQRHQLCHPRSGFNAGPSAEQQGIKHSNCMSGNELILLALLSGVIYPLERVPDPVFSQKLAGDELRT